MSNVKQIKFPKKNEQGQEILEVDGSIVIVGANGAGKTRLSVWIDKNNPEMEVYRISAHRNLTMPDRSRISTLVEAEKNLYYGHPTHSKSQRQSKHGNKPEIDLQSDFDKLMELLFSEAAKIATQFLNRYREAQTQDEKEKITCPLRKVDILAEIWGNILPDRKLIIGEASIEVSILDNQGKKYNASEMSDGERGLFYLIGQCLCAPEKAVIIIDEPDNHIHQAIRGKVWDAIENKRPDCTFLYITHDLEFATSRKNATKICISKYDGTNWDWFEVPEYEKIPEEVVLKILGSRKPILFLEGGKNSLDTKLYSLLYPNYTIVSLGSCRKVVDSVREFNNLKEFHHNEAYGIIDRDHRSDDEISTLKIDKLFISNVAEIENLLLCEEILRAVANDLHEEDIDKVVKEIKDYVIDEFKKNKNQQVTQKLEHTVRYELKTNLSFHKEANKEDTIDAWKIFSESIEIGEIYDKILSELDQAIEGGKYEEILKLFNQKNLIKQIGSKFTVLKTNGYSKHIEMLMRSSPDIIVNAVSHLVPSLPEFKEKGSENSL